MKKIVAVLFSLIFVASLASCGAKDKTQAEIMEASEIGTMEELTGEKEAAESDVSETAEETTERETATETTINKITETEYKAAFKRFLLNYIKENTDNADENRESRFGFIYLDEDDVPELIIQPPHGGRSTQLNIYSFDGEKVNHVAEYGVYADFEFIVGKGILFCDSTHQGFGHIEYSEYKGGKIKTIIVFHYDYDYLNYDPEDYENWDYFINEKPVSYEEYKETEERINKKYETEKAVSAAKFLDYTLNKYEIESVLE